jgi:hypothetical protein
LFDGNTGCGVLVEQLEQQFSELLAHVPDLVVYFCLDEIPLEKFFVLAQTIVNFTIFFDRIFPELELKSHNSQFPDVGLFSELAFDDFWRHILHSPHKSRDSFGFAAVEEFGEGVVGEFDVSVVADENIFWLKGTIENSVLVQVVECDYNFCEDVADGDFGEFVAVLVDVEVEIALGKVFHDDVDVVIEEEGFLDVDQEGVLPDFEKFGTLKQIHFLDLELGDHLHGVALAGYLFLRKHHHSVTALPEHPHMLILRCFVQGLFGPRAGFECRGGEGRMDVDCVLGGGSPLFASVLCGSS